MTNLSSNEKRRPVHDGQDGADIFAVQPASDAVRAAARLAGEAATAPAATVSPNEVMATLEKLGELKTKGILT